MRTQSKRITPFQSAISPDPNLVSYQKIWNIPQLSFPFYLENECQNCAEHFTAHERICPNCGESLHISLDPALFLNYLNTLTVFWETSRLELNDMITELFQPLAPYLIASVLGQIQEELVDTVLPYILHQAVQIGKLFMVVKLDMGVIVEKIAEKIRELQNTHPEIPANPFHRVLTAYQEKYKIQQKFGRKAPNDKSRSSEGTRLQTELQTILTEFHALHASFRHQTEIKNNYRRFTKQFQSILAQKTPAELVRMNVEYYVLLRVIKAIGFFSITPETIHQKKNKKRSSPFFSRKNRNQKHERSSNRKIRKQKQGHASIPSSRKTRKYLQEGIL